MFLFSMMFYSFADAIYNEIGKEYSDICTSLHSLWTSFLFCFIYIDMHCLTNGFPGGTCGKEPTCQCRRHKRTGSIPGLGRFPGEGNGNPLQYSCLEDLIDRGARWATAHWVVKSWTQLKWLSMYPLTNIWTIFIGFFFFLILGVNFRCFADMICRNSNSAYCENRRSLLSFSQSNSFDLPKELPPPNVVLINNLIYIYKESSSWQIIKVSVLKPLIHTI